MSSTPLVGMQIATLKAQLDYIFSQQTNSFFLTESQVKSDYESQTKKDFYAELRLTEMSFQQFMRNSFFNEYNIVDDPSGVTFYIKREFLMSQVAAQLPIGAPTTNNSNGSSTNGSLAPGPPRLPNGSLFNNMPTFNSQSVHSSSNTPTSPPIVPPSRNNTIGSSFNQVPPGFPAVNRNASNVDRRMDTLQKQLSDRGLEGCFHPQALKHHFGDLSELMQEDENRSLFREEINGKNHNNSGLLNLDLHRVPPTLESQSNLTNVSIGEIVEEYSETGIVESPDGSVYEQASEGFGGLEINEVHEDFPPINSDAPGLTKKNSLPPGFENVINPHNDQYDEPEGVETEHFEPESIETESIEPRTSQMFHKPRRPRGVAFPMSYPDDFQVEHSKLFYAVIQDGIQNSSDVNSYREKYQKFLDETTGLYKGISEEFKWLTGYHFSNNPNVGGFMPNHSFIIDLLQMYAKLFKNGMKPKDLIEMEKDLCTVGQSVCLGQSTLIMSVVEMVNRGLIYSRNNLYHVHPDILEIELWKLPAGLTSNLYRVLNAQQITMVQDVSSYEGILKNYNGDPIYCTDEDIIRQANQFPLIFKVKAQGAEQHSMRTASIQINEKLPRWKVLLDQKTYPTILFHCECGDCLQSGVTLPVVVPEAGGSNIN